MKILWFTNTSVSYNNIHHNYNGGGWMTSLENEFRKKENIELAISFKTISSCDHEKIVNGVRYFPIHIKNKNVFLKLFDTFFLFKKYDESVYNDFINQQLKIIESFSPDIIQVFGSEEEFGLISLYTKKPVVLHLQGIINPYLIAFLPPAFSWANYIYSKKNIKTWIEHYRSKQKWIYISKRELKILGNTKYFIGRTEWDYRISRLLSPQSKYYYGSEILRAPFYLQHNRSIPANLVITTTISKPLYKGYDVILKTANILKKHIEFEWNVFGNIDKKTIEKTVGIISENVNVYTKGVVSSEELTKSILNSTIYVHPSYIDNSPNSICEAQLLGVTVLASNVGGVSSLIKHNDTGFLVPANDPFQMAYMILYIYDNINVNLHIGNNAKKIAMSRHDKDEISNSLIAIYESIINSHEK